MNFNFPPEDSLGEDYAELEGALSKEAQVLRLLYVEHDLNDFAQQLKKLDDGLPVPETFSWEEQPNPFRDEEKQFQGPDKRLFSAFEQIVLQGRKSGKYLKQAQSLFERMPLQGLAISLAQYLIRWQPEDVYTFVLKCTQEHEDWHTLRFMAASHLLQMEAQVELPEKLKYDYQALMLKKQALHEFGILALDSLTVLCYYLAEALFYSRQGQHLLRALYALNVCFQISQKSQTPAEKAPWQQVLDLWFARVQELGLETEINDFMLPLLNAKRKRWETRQKSSL